MKWKRADAQMKESFRLPFKKIFDSFLVWKMPKSIFQKFALSKIFEGREDFKSGGGKTRRDEGQKDWRKANSLTAIPFRRPPTGKRLAKLLRFLCTDAAKSNGEPSRARCVPGSDWKERGTGVWFCGQSQHLKANACLGRERCELFFVFEPPSGGQGGKDARKDWGGDVAQFHVLRCCQFFLAVKTKACRQTA